MKDLLLLAEIVGAAAALMLLLLFMSWANHKMRKWGRDDE